jgi:hypothetical protein
VLEERAHTDRGVLGAERLDERLLLDLERGGQIVFDGSAVRISNPRAARPA